MNPRRAAAALCLWLAACTEGPITLAPEPPAPEVSDIVEVQVAVVDGEQALISVIQQTTRPDRSLRDWTLQTWRPGAQPQLLARQGDDGDRRLAAAPGPLAWYVLDEPDSLARWCRRTLVGEADCTELPPEHVAEVQAAGDDGRTLLVFRPDAAGRLLAARADAQGRSAPQPVPAGGRAEAVWPLPLAGADALLLRHGETLDLHRFDPGSGQWSAAQAIGRLRPASATGITVVRQRGSDAALVVWCDAGTVQARRLTAGGVEVLAEPPVPGCELRTDSMRLAVSDIGDAMLLWSVGLDWLSSRWSAAAGAWQAPVPLVTERQTQPVLAADGQGRFIAVYGTRPGDGPGRLWMRTHRPGDGWLPEIDLGSLHQNAVHDVAADAAGRAVVAWAGPAPFTPAGEPGSRLAVRELHLGDTLVALTVRVEGGGRVDSDPAGLDCAGTCSAPFVLGRPVTLTARPADGQAFAGWSGDTACQGHGPVLAWTLDGITACTARFEPLTRYALTLTVQGGGRASASPAGPNHEPGTVVTLSATPGAGQRFVAWGGDADCSDGQVTMTAARTCTAVFEADPTLAALTLTISGGGRLISAPAGLDCPGRCQAWFALGTSVVLTAEPPAGASAVWSGACGGTTGLSATVVLGAARQCGVDFQVPAPEGWRTLASPLPGSGGIVGRPAIAADAQGVPTVAFLTETADLRELQVLRLAGAGWQRVGGVPLNDPLVSANEPSLALDDQGRPLVAWGDARGRVQVRHWDGSQWRHLADDLSLTPGATTSSPQIAFDGQRVVVALLEYPSNRAHPVLLRSALDNPAWNGAVVDAVQMDGGGLLSLALDATGRGLLAHVSGSGVAGELAPRVVQEGAAGWSPHCDGGVGPDPGQAYLSHQLGFGLQSAPGGGSLLVRVRNDAQAVQAWRCNGSGAWALDGPTGAGLVTVDNVLTYLHAVATGRSGPPTAAVLVGTGYDGGSELHAFVYGAVGFQSVGPPLQVDRRGLLGTLAVAAAAPASPVAAYGVEPTPGARELRAARFHP